MYDTVKIVVCDGCCGREPAKVKKEHNARYNQDYEIVELPDGWTASPNRPTLVHFCPICSAKLASTYNFETATGGESYVE